MRLNETKRKQRTSQEEVLAEMFAEAELQDSVRKKKNWDAWMESEVEQQIDEEIRKYLAESSDPTVYLTPKEAKAWNRMPKSKQQRLLQKESQQVFKEWQAGERKAFAGAERRPDDLRQIAGEFCVQRQISIRIRYCCIHIRCFRIHCRIRRRRSEEG